MPLRVAINATPLLSPLTGIGNYVLQLGRALAATGSVDLHSFYGGSWRHEPPSPPAGAAPRGRPSIARELIKRVLPMKRELRQAYQQVMFNAGARRAHIDLYHEPNYVPLRYDAPVVITVHDLSWLRFPETHPRDRVRWLERGLPRALEQAGAILVDSEFVRDELLATFAVPSHRVRVAHLGVSAAFRPRPAEETSPTLRAVGLRHGWYVLSVGTIEPRKNVEHLLEAYGRLPAALREQFPLVIAGARGWRAAGMERRLNSLAGRGDVRFVGEVSATDLPNLYAGAALFVFPSLYEGFGLPPLEAMASGVPVLVSNRASLPEVVGDAGILFDPLDPERTAAGMAGLLQDAGARGELARRGLTRARQFTWSACADATLAAYHAALA